MNFIRDHPLSTYANFFEKLTFLTPWYAHVRVRIRGLEMLVFQKILRTFLMDGPLSVAFTKYLICLSLKKLSRDVNWIWTYEMNIYTVLVTASVIVKYRSMREENKIIKVIMLPDVRCFNSSFVLALLNAQRVHLHMVLNNSQVL